MLQSCHELLVLKVSSLTGINDRSIIAMVNSFGSSKTIRLPVLQEIEEEEKEEHTALGGSPPKLENLRLRDTDISSTGLAAFLSFCGSTLNTLDVSFTRVKHLDVIGQYCNTPLKKLNISKLELAPFELYKLVQRFHDKGIKLKKLIAGGSLLITTSATNSDLIKVSD